MTTATTAAMTIEMSEDGTLVLPPEVRDALGIVAGEQFTFQVDPIDSSVTLYARGGDESWMYTEESLASFRRGVADIEAGRVRQMSEEDLRRLAPCD